MSDGSTPIDDEREEFTAAKQLQFVIILKKFPLLLEKSQIPSVKIAKSKAANTFLMEVEDKLGMKTTEKQLYKKLNNMKTKIKAKTDRNRTGNFPIKLQDWEKEFLNLMKPETNPTFSKVPGSVSAGFKRTNETVIEYSQTQSGLSSVQIPPVPQAAKKRKTCEELMKQAETTETVGLSTNQLQRLVLIEQLKLIRLKQNKYVSELNNNHQGEKGSEYYVVANELVPITTIEP